jgi:transcription-repair coupling factor (superfamily II helicase)
MQPDLRPLLYLLEDMPAYKEMLGRLVKLDKETRVLLTQAAKPYLIAALYQKMQLPMLVITAQPETAKRLSEQISLWCHSGGTEVFPEPDMLPYQRAMGDLSVEQDRLRILSSLTGFEKSREPSLIVSSAPALIQKTTSKEDFTSSCNTLETGSNYELLSLLRRWEAMGYRMETAVELPGTVSHRGGIVDLFPPTSDSPVRMEFFGNTIESIRLFDPATQRSQKVVFKVSVCPATELLPARKSEAIKSAFKSLDLSYCSR